VGSIPSRAALRSNLEQVIHTCVPLSPSSIIQYEHKDGDFLPYGLVSNHGPS